jgi:hypothetical protein
VIDGLPDDHLPLQELCLQSALDRSTCRAPNLVPKGPRCCISMKREIGQELVGHPLMVLR